MSKRAGPLKKQHRTGGEGVIFYHRRQPIMLDIQLTIPYFGGKFYH
jgi:hypothetical protein